MHVIIYAEYFALILLGLFLWREVFFFIYCNFHQKKWSELAHDKVASIEKQTMNAKRQRFKNRKDAKKISFNGYLRK